ncbi:hypothetical protein B0H14DRAFT_3459328 [Mycena olivaceomarginata]|nr:hypothetical protein B0H14DRAFT_3459328 [Mycena olivaceomarginata]
MFRLSSSVFSALVLSTVTAFAYDPTRTENLVVYWGQNSSGATNGSDVPYWQQTISDCCQGWLARGTCIGVIPIAFVDRFSGGIPDLSLGNESSFPHRNCESLAGGIQACQAKVDTLRLRRAFAHAGWAPANHLPRPHGASLADVPSCVAQLSFLPSSMLVGAQA